MSNIDKRPYRADGGDISTGRLKEIADNPYGDEEKCWLAKRVLASLEAEIHSYTFEDDPRPLYTAPLAPVSVPDAVTAEDCPAFVKYDITEVDEAWARGFNACRAAMLQGADNEIHDALCAKYNVESLADFVDWQRNHIAELEAAPPAPVGKGETAVMPDYPGYVMTQRECFHAGKKAVLTEAGNSPVIPDGWVMVPVEPTYQMCEAMGLTWERPRFPDRYKAMIAAAPHFRENAETSTKCWCRTCRPITLTDMRFVVCPVCGNKRCPHANDHRNACSGSNEPGQEGSAYPAAPQQEADNG